MLDSAPLAALLHARPAAVSQMTPWLNRHEAATSILMYAEVIEYLKSQPDFPRHLAALRTLYSPKSILVSSPMRSLIAMLTFGVHCARHMGRG